MNPISNNLTVQTTGLTASLVKKADVQEPADEFKPIRTEPDIHSMKDYASNLADSTGLGFAGGFVKTSKFVDKFMPHYDGLDHPGKHLLASVPPIFAGAVGGVAGIGVGFTMGLAGQNIGTHISQRTLQM